MDEVLMLSFLLIASASYVYYFSNKRHRRRYAVRPINRLRQEKGLFNNLLRCMASEDHEMFFKYTRMTPKMFLHLLELLRPRLLKDPTKNPLPPEHRLILTLHYLASGCSMQELAFSHYLGLTTVSVVIKETLDAIYSTVQPLVLKEPTAHDWTTISQEYFLRWNIPNCIGAIDGKHVQIQAPFNSGSEFFNYKKTHSIVLMAACDAYYRFTLVDVGAEGGNHDSVVFRDSGFGKKILKKEMPIPTPQFLPNSNVKLPFFFVADAAFPLHIHIMRPFPGKHLLLEKRVYNYRLSRGRRTIENTFGILVQRWRILKRSLDTTLDTCEKIVLACVVLHNFIQRGKNDMDETEKQYCPTGYVDEECASGSIRPGAWRNDGRTLTSVRRLGANNSSRDAFVNRESLCEFFNSVEGSLPWQFDYVMRGSVPPDFQMEM